MILNTLNSGVTYLRGNFKKGDGVRFQVKVPRSVVCNRGFLNSPHYVYHQFLCQDFSRLLDGRCINQLEDERVGIEIFKLEIGLRGGGSLGESESNKYDHGNE